MAERLAQGRTSKADLEELVEQLLAAGLPAQGVSTLRTRIYRLQRRQEGVL